jgi:hypothetical protein
MCRECHVWYARCPKARLHPPCRAKSIAVSSSARGIQMAACPAPSSHSPQSSCESSHYLVIDLQNLLPDRWPHRRGTLAGLQEGAESHSSAEAHFCCTRRSLSCRMLYMVYQVQKMLNGASGQCLMVHPDIRGTTGGTGTQHLRLGA